MAITETMNVVATSYRWQRCWLLSWAQGRGGRRRRSSCDSSFSTSGLWILMAKMSKIRILYDVFYQELGPDNWPAVCHFLSKLHFSQTSCLQTCLLCNSVESQTCSHQPWWILFTISTFLVLLTTMNNRLTCFYNLDCESLCEGRAHGVNGPLDWFCTMATAFRDIHQRPNIDQIFHEKKISLSK